MSYKTFYGILIVIIIVLIYFAWTKNPNIVQWLIVGALLAATNYVLNCNCLCDNPEEKHIIAKGSGVSSYVLPKLNIEEVTKETVGKALKLLKKSSHSAASVAASAASIGLGGDIIVDLLYLTLDSAVLLGQLTSGVLSVINFGTDFKNLNFKNGPDGVLEFMQEYEKTNANHMETYEKIHNLSDNIIEQTVNIFTQVIGAMIPDDAGMISWIGSDLIIYTLKEAKNSSFNSLRNFYNKFVPKYAKELMQNPAKLSELLNLAIDTMQKQLLGKDSKTLTQSIMSRVKGNIAAFSVVAASLLIPGGIMFIGTPTIILNAFSNIGGASQINKAIDYFIKPNIDNLSKLMQIIMPVMFMILYVNDKYNNLLNANTTEVPTEIVNSLEKIERKVDEGNNLVTATVIERSGNGYSYYDSDEED